MIRWSRYSIKGGGKTGWDGAGWNGMGIANYLHYSDNNKVVVTAIEISSVKSKSSFVQLVSQIKKLYIP